MHIVIMGCGRVGSTLAHILEDQGHSVAVIDQDVEAFRKLRPGFRGSKITGIGFDRDVLIEAGIEKAHAFAAVSSGDNSNVIAARVARESFGVQRSLVLAELSCCDDWLGEKVSALEANADTRIAFISRLGEALLPGPGTVLQQGDVLHVMAKEDDLKRIASVFAKRAVQGRGSH